MINSILSTNYQQFLPQINFDIKLTDDQKKELQTIIAKYDSQNMTEESSESLRNEIRSAQIPPSSDVRNALESAGFSVKPPSDRPMGPPPPPKVNSGSGIRGTNISSSDDSTEDSGSTDSTLETSQIILSGSLLEFLENLKSGKIAKSDIESLVKYLQNINSTTQGNLLDIQA